MPPAAELELPSFDRTDPELRVSSLELDGEPEFGTPSGSTASIDCR